MEADITSGNTIKDGKDFRCWFIGPVERWCRDNDILFDTKKFGLRNNNNLEIKWGIYKKGEERSAWAPGSDKTAMSILIRGDVVFKFCDLKNKGMYREVRLKNEGDYVIWRETVQHTWKMEQDSVNVTIRW